MGRRGSVENREHSGASYADKLQTPLVVLCFVLGVGAILVGLALGGQVFAGGGDSGFVLTMLAISIPLIAVGIAYLQAGFSVRRKRRWPLLLLAATTAVLSLFLVLAFISVLSSEGIGPALLKLVVACAFGYFTRMLLRVHRAIAGDWS